MQKDATQTLFAHMEWADAETWSAALAQRDAQRDQRLLQLLYHLHTVQWVYLQMWRSQQLDIPPEGGFRDISAVLAWARPYYPEVYAFLRGVDEASLRHTLAIPWAAEVKKRYGSAGDVTLAETMMQVVLHSTYHRAQIATRIRELGGEPSVTDFVAWLWRTRPGARWTTEAEQV